MNTQNTSETALDEFTMAYIMAALWTFDEDAPSGEYETSGRFETLFPLIDRTTLLKMIEDANAFQKENATLISQAELSESRAGHNFWLSRNGHGSGFFDEYSQTECDAYEREQKIAVETRDFSKREALIETCPCRYHACLRLQNRAGHEGKWGSFDLYYGDDNKIYGSHCKRSTPEKPMIETTVTIQYLQGEQVVSMVVPSKELPQISGHCTYWLQDVLDQDEIERRGRLLKARVGKTLKHNALFPASK